jgi:hypothetical protein
MVSPTLGEDVHADEAAHLGPLVVLLGKDCADEAGECLARIHRSIASIVWALEVFGLDGD